MNKRLIDMEKPKRGKNFADIKSLIRSLQRNEGNLDCFGKAPHSCGQVECTWREYCLQFRDKTETEEFQG
jgi:hypothetical protein